MRCLSLLLALSVQGQASAAGNPRTCIGSVPIATFQLRVTPPGGGPPLPIRLVNTIQRGSKLACTPVKLPPDLKKNARVAVVLVPATAGDAVTVLDLRTLDGPTEWSIPFQPGAVLLVFGPQGVDEKRVNNLVSKDDDLVSELAMYADQTEDLEDTIDSLAAVEEAGDDDVDVTPVRGSPSDQVLFALTRALNPVMMGYNPLGGGKKQGPATMMGKASDAFFENAGGFVPGGGALPAVKTWLMPDTEFRTVYTEPAAQDGLTLCAQRKTAGSRNRYVYLWAHRTVNSGPPTINTLQPVWLPVGTRATFAVKLKTVDEWPLVDRVREWTLVGGAAPIAVKVRSDQRRYLEVDLRKTTAAPGAYHLQGKWDWGTVQVNGDFNLAAPADASKVKLVADSQGVLVAGRGVVPARFEGSEFQFVERVTLRKAGRLGGVPTDLDYVLPIGPRAGPQQTIEVEIDTNHFRAGDYLLALAQTGGATQNVPVKVLPSMPRIDNLPLRVNAGAKDLKLTLRGADLDRIDGLTAEHATIRLGSANATEREVIVTVDASAKKGETLALQIGVGGVADAARLPAGIAVVGPRPRIVGVKLSPPDDLGTALREGEVPAGSFVGMSVQVENVDSPPALRLDCVEAAKTLEAQRVRAGERRRAAKLDSINETSLFASFDPGAVGAGGCSLQAAVETDTAGASEPMAVGHVVRLPRIESVTLTNEKVDQGYGAVLRGWDLETIEKTGWDASTGLAVPGPPRSSAGEGDRQTLRVVLPWPSPTPMAPVYVWLRGDKEGRQALKR
jgi:hypothetical protein